MSGTLKYVEAFARLMESKLAENRHKGDRDGWQTISSEELLQLLRDEVDELSVALIRNRAPNARTRKAVRRECADIANFALMIADVAGGLST